MGRKIEPKMIAFLDKKLEHNGLAQLAIDMRDPRTLMLQAAQACVGIREKSGRNDGPMVELIQETIGGHNREAWCMALMQTCIAYAEVKTGIKSPILSSEHCVTTWEDTPKEQRVKISPLPGAIIIWQHGKSSNGHTGIVIGADDKNLQAVEGNTTSGSDDPNGKVEREGGGVYFTRRSRKGNGDMHILGYLKPF